MSEEKTPPAADQHGESDSDPTRSEPAQPLTHRSFQSIVDQRIAAAEAAGLFADLPGAGKPLKLDDDALVPEEDRAAFRLLRNAGFAPPWIELQKQILADQARLKAWCERIQQRWTLLGQSERDRLRADYRQQLQELNTLIMHYNLIVPRAAGQLAPLHIEQALMGLEGREE